MPVGQICSLAKVVLLQSNSGWVTKTRFLDNGETLNGEGDKTHGYLDGGPFLCPDAVGRLACDAGIVRRFVSGYAQHVSLERCHESTEAVIPRSFCSPILQAVRVYFVVAHFT